MSREKLEESLEKIGWRILRSSNGLNDWIINHKGERTGFKVRKDSLEVTSPAGKKLFGENASNFGVSGILCFNLLMLRIEYDKQTNSVSADVAGFQLTFLNMDD